MSEQNGLPNGWAEATLADVSNVVRGISFPKDAKRSASFPGSIVCLRTTNVQSEVDWTDLWHVSQQHVGREEQLVCLHDILISTANSLELVGKVALVREVHQPATLGAFISLIRSQPAILPHFLYHQLATDRVQQCLRMTASTTTNISNISTKKVLEVVLGIAPLDEQRRIVAKIEELFSDLDAGVAALERIRANLKRYRATVLKAAVEGKLTEEWRAKHPTTEPASKLLERILSELRRKWEEDQLTRFIAANKTPPKGWQDKYAEPASPDMSGLAELPDGWCWATIEQVCREIVDCPHSTPKWTTEGEICVRTTEFRPGKLLLDDVRYVSPSTYQERIARLRPEAGDVLYSREGGILGIACSIPVGARLCLGQRMMLLRAFVSGQYLMHVMNSSAVLSKVRKLTTGSASPHLNVGEVRQFTIPFPPEKEQIEIVAEIERRISIVEEVEVQVDANMKRAARLRQSILKRAFEGRLVPQDPTDEPADKLLERIKAARDGKMNGEKPPRTRPSRRVSKMTDAEE